MTLIINIVNDTVSWKLVTFFGLRREGSISKPHETLWISAILEPLPPRTQRKEKKEEEEDREQLANER